MSDCCCCCGSSQSVPCGVRGASMSDDAMFLEELEKQRNKQLEETENFLHLLTEMDFKSIKEMNDYIIKNRP